MRLFTLVLLFFSFICFSQDEMGVGNDIQQSENKAAEFAKRDKVLWNFKLKLSNLITSSPNGVFNKEEIKDYIKELNEIEDDLVRWSKEVDLEDGKLKSLGVLLDQNKKIQKEIIQVEKKDQKKVKEVRKLIKEIGKDETSVRKLIRKIKAHKKNISLFKEDKKRWEKYLFSVIKKDVGTSLYEWRINNFFFSPLSEMAKTSGEIGKTLSENFNSFDENYFKNNIGKLVFISIALALAAIGLLFLMDLVHNRYRGVFFKDTPVIGEIFSKFYQDRIILILFGYFFFWFQIQFSLVEEAILFFYLVIVWPFSSYLWVRLSPIILNLIKKDEETKSINPAFFSVFFLIYLANAGINFSSEPLFFLSSIFSIFIGRYLVELVFKFIQENKKSCSLAIRLSSYLVILLSSLVMVSSVIGLLGFQKLALGIQQVLFSNFLSFFVVIFIYQMLISPLKSLGEKKVLTIGAFKFGEELIYFFKSLINTATLFVFVHLVLSAWSENILLFSSLWDTSIFSVGEFNLTLIQPVKLIFSYYIFRGVYLLALSSIDVFWLTYFDISPRYSTNIKTIVRYGFILVFLSVSLGILGFTYKNIVIFASALGVGIGFGLQNIVNNFISGIILLFERPIRLGDLVEINNDFCRVTHIGIRSTVVESIDNSSIIIPNSEILSNKLINWTLNNNVIAINCSVGVAYGTDTEKVTEVLKGVLEEVNSVLKYPEAKIWFEEFADSSLNFKLKFWINEPIKQFQIKSDVMHLINEKLAQSNITIPFPQRDVHLFEEKKI